MRDLRDMQFDYADDVKAFVSKLEASFHGAIEDKTVAEFPIKIFLLIQ